ncbi:MAG: HupE/UreJ family protein [Sinobacteraceae bacterium]|nr:HupE/UreJ family protein [Nevskiaceae bacterium]
MNRRVDEMPSTVCSLVTLRRAGLYTLSILLYVLLAVACAPAEAHKPSDSYLTLSVAGQSVSGRWDIALRDIDFAIGLDANGDGNITWGELRARHADIAAYALARLMLVADGARCDPHAISHRVDTHTDGAYEVLYFSADCPAIPHELRVRYRLFFDLDPQHKGLLKLDANGVTRSAIFSVTSAEQGFDLARASRIGQFLQYAVEGVFHIWTGYDHILFLLSLLLPAVLVRQAGGWRAVASLRPAFVEVFRVVTAFTLAHSITLSLATLGVVRPPSRWVESAIAASVLIAALGNLFSFADRRRWAIAFAFGLIHGFGFAAVLSDLGLQRQELLLGLVGFNLGVEAGQMVIVAGFLPVAFALRGTWVYRYVTLVGGSVAIAAIAAVWLTERAFDIRL